MNANELWSGNDYAHTDNISRGAVFYENAHRVKVMRVYKIAPGYGETRQRTMVEVHMLKDDGTPRIMVSGDPMIKQVRARDIFARWDDYAAERKHRHENRERLAAQAAEEQANDERLRSAILDELEKKLNNGFNRLWITNITPSTIVLSRKHIEDWLEVK